MVCGSGGGWQTQGCLLLGGRAHLHRLFRLWAQGGRGAYASSPKRVRGLWRELQKSLPPAMPAAKKGNCKNLGLEPCSGCRSKTGCLLESAKRPLSEVPKTAGLSPPRQRAKQRAHVASCLRAQFIRSVVALCVISCAAAAGGVAIAAEKIMPSILLEAATR